MSEGAVRKDLMDAIELDDPDLICMILSAQARTDPGSAAGRVLPLFAHARARCVGLVCKALVAQYAHFGYAVSEYWAECPKPAIASCAAIRDSASAMRQLLRGETPLCPEALDLCDWPDSEEGWQVLEVELYIAVIQPRVPTALLDAVLEAVPARTTRAKPVFGGEALLVAANRGDARSLRVLLSCAAVDIAATDENGCTALHIAAAGAHTEALRVLLQHLPGPSGGAERGAGTVDSAESSALLSAHDAWHNTPLHWAAMNRRGAECVELLLDAGADPCKEDSDGFNAAEAMARKWVADAQSELARREDSLLATWFFFWKDGGYADSVRAVLRAWEDTVGEPVTGESNKRGVAGSLGLFRMLLDWLDPKFELDSANVAERYRRAPLRAAVWALLHEEPPPDLCSGPHAAQLRKQLHNAVGGGDSELVRLMAARYHPTSAAFGAACREELPRAAKLGCTGVLRILLECLHCEDELGRCPTSTEASDSARARVASVLTEALRQACAAGEASAVRLLLSAAWPKGALSAALAAGGGSDGDESPLISTTQPEADDRRPGSNADVAKVLLAAGASVRHPEQGSRPIHYAVKRNSLDVLRALLELQPDQVALRDELGNTALHLAAGYLEAIGTDAAHLLLRAHAAEGVPIDVRNDAGVTPLLAAVRAAQIDVVWLLVRAGADTAVQDPQSGRRVMHDLVNHADTEQRYDGSLAHVLFAAERPPDVYSRDDSGTTAVHTAADVGNDRFLRVIAELRPDALAQLCHAPATLSQASPLWLAARMGHTAAVRVLLSHSTPADAGATWPAPTTNSADRSDGAEVAVTTLMAAAAHGWMGTVSVLLGDAQHGCLNATDSVHSRTALHYAARFGCTGVVRMLVAAHRDANAAFCMDVQDAAGGTPLQYAVQHGNVSTTKYLLSEGAKCGHIASHGRSLLRVALAPGCETACTVWLVLNLLEQDRHDGAFELTRELLLDP